MLCGCSNEIDRLTGGKKEELTERARKPEVKTKRQRGFMKFGSTCVCGLGKGKCRKGEALKKMAN